MTQGEANQIIECPAPHGGTWVRTADGFVEISVFETDVPPHFRLYFFDAEMRPLVPDADASVVIETRRPEGQHQFFQCRQEGEYLRSTADIPEPHEFTVGLMLGREGTESQTYETIFTESDHGHGGHDHGDHGHGGHHGHGSGIWGWFQEKFAHSHSITDQTDAAMESTERGIQTLKITLLIMGLTALFQVIIVLASGSVALLADTIHNFADACTSVPLWIAFVFTRRGANRRFTYGYGKIEDVAGVLIVALIFFSACVAGYESVTKIIDPQPMENTGWVAAAAIIGFIGNEWVALYRIRVGKEIGSAALVADGYHARVDGFTSLAVLIGVIGAWIGIPIIDPLVGLGITVTILIIVKDATKSVWVRLIDGIEPEILEQIEHAPMHVPGVKAVREVRARWIGHKVHTDVVLDALPDLTVREADALAVSVERSLLEHIPLLGSAVVRVRPVEDKHGITLD